ncbi:MAG: quinol:cytochrome C oxidoreductase [Ignavibacteria bacterium]|jgi:hypothetical protein|nr:quinol:cytochrome C oxidoreductase [Ignavibacteria bacterium]
MSQSNLNYIKKDLPTSLQKIGFLLIGIGVIGGAGAFLLNAEQAAFNYLLGFMFLMSIGVGALFLISLEYVAGADWSTPLRRVIEFTASITPFLIILAIPILLNMHTLFHWSHTEVVESDKILKEKAPYLNQTFFFIRVAIVFALWTLFYFLLTRNSRKQDISKDQNLTRVNIRLSAVFIPLFAITASIASIDWMMSLEPHWFSTIFGVYFFSGSVLSALAVITYATVKLREGGYLHPRMVKDHYYSLGSLLFVFVNFWGYIAFSQYMLIWYANLPEETFWFLARWQGSWIYISLALIFVHFIVPYSILLSQPAKMDAKKLKFASLWILFAHLLDLYWLILPTFKGESTLLNFVLGLSFPVAAVGGIILLFYFNSKKTNMVPVGDPKLERGLNFRL